MFFWRKLGTTHRSVCCQKCNERDCSCTVAASSNCNDGRSWCQDSRLCVCDRASTNTRMWSILGINGRSEDSCNSFTHAKDPTRSVLAFSDAPHLFKCIRNRLKQQRYLKKGGQWIRWEDYAVVYKEDLTNAGNLKARPKVTHAHICPNNYEKMRGKLATQVFSPSIASGILFHREQGVHRLTNSEGT